MMTIVSSLFALVVVCYLNQAASEVTYTITTDHDLCTVPQPCLTLSQFAANSSHYLHSNTTLVFLPGTHHLTVRLTVSNVQYFSMHAENSDVQIMCINSLFIFTHSRHIDITSINFIGCGSNRVEHVMEFMLQDAIFQGQQNSRTALKLIETSAQIINGTFVSIRVGTYKVFYDKQEHRGSVGGALVVAHSVVDIRHSHFHRNRADYGGAIFAETYSIINISNTTFNVNAASTHGGVLYSSSSTITVKESEFDRNTALSGGVLYPLMSNITIVASTFHSNIATWQGGVIRSRNSVITITACNFDINTSIGSGGGGGVLYLLDSSVKIQASDFNNSRTDFTGGVVYSQGSTIEMEASEFYNNTGLYGGVVISFHSSVTVKACRLHCNSATTQGGALDIHESNVTIEASEFDKNSAANGGALYSRGGTNVTIEASHFSNNTASNSGGALYSSDSNVIIRECQFNNNMANSGRGLYSLGSSVTIRGTNPFNNITAAYREGVLHSSNSIIIIEPSLNVSDDNNTSTEFEGGTLDNISASDGTTSVIGLQVNEPDITSTTNDSFISSTQTGPRVATKTVGIPLTTTEVEASRLIVIEYYFGSIFKNHSHGELQNTFKPMHTFIIQETTQILLNQLS